MEKGDFENPRVINCNFSTKSVPDYYGFCNSTVPWGHKNRTIWGVPVYILADSGFFKMVHSEKSGKSAVVQRVSF